MQTKKLHNWDLSYQQAIALQKELCEKVQLVGLKNPPKTVAGIDCAISKDGQRIIAAVVVLRGLKTERSPSDTHEFEIVETTYAVQKVSFPYIPGLLSFREAPACIDAVERLEQEPDTFIIDGQGIAHPRRFGIAAHLGLFFDKPTIGCAKSRLTGTFEEPSLEKGAYSDTYRQKRDYRRGSANTHQCQAGFCLGRQQVPAKRCDRNHSCLHG